MLMPHLHFCGYCEKAIAFYEKAFHTKAERHGIQLRAIGESLEALRGGGHIGGKRILKGRTVAQRSCWMASVFRNTGILFLWEKAGEPCWHAS